MKKRIVSIALITAVFATSVFGGMLPVYAEEAADASFVSYEEPEEPAADADLHDSSDRADGYDNEYNYDDEYSYTYDGDPFYEYGDPALCEDGDNAYLTGEEPVEDTFFDPELYGDVPVSSTRSGRDSIAKLSMKELAALNAAIGSYSSRFSVSPVLGQNYRPGKLTDNAYAYMTRLINYYRTNAGLGNITLGSDANTDAAYGALVMAMAQHFSHYPNRPAYISDVDYERGREATRTSNISYCWGYEESTILGLAITGQMADESGNNLSCLGHRRWLLHPWKTTFGVGSATDSAGQSYTDVKVFGLNTAQDETLNDYDFIAWPASGNNLSNRFTASIPWSVTLNPNMYQSPSAAAVKVTLESLTSGKVWNLYSGSNAGYFHVDNQSYGISNCIIFRPSNAGSYRGVYLVTITGIKDSSGNATSIRYPVVFETAAAAASAPDFTNVVTSVEDLQSAHPYEAGKDLSWVYTCPENAQGIDIAFSTDTMLSGSDKIRVYDGKSKMIGEYTSDQLSGKTLTVSGRTVQIRLISVTGGGYGFKVDQITKSIPVTAIRLDRTTAEMIVGKELALHPSFEPLDATVRPEIIWSSSNANIASVDQEGKITANAKGTATITAKADKLSATCKVTVFNKLSDITLSETEVRLFLNQTAEIGYTLIPADARIESLTVKSNNAAMLSATDEDGRIALTAKVPGTTSVTLTADGITKEIPVRIFSTAKLHHKIMNGSDVGSDISATYGEPFGTHLYTPDVPGGLSFVGWYTLPDGKGDKVTQSTIATNQFDIYAYYRAKADTAVDFSAETTSEPVFTGKAVKPEIRVFAGGVPLKEKTDYTLTFKNNVKAYTYTEEDPAFDASLAPLVTVTGKGKYNGTANLFFTIAPVDLADVDAPDQWFAVDDKLHQSIPAVMDGKTKLVSGRDFTCTFPDTVDGAYRLAGDYKAVLTGTGNYTGTKISRIRIYDDSTLVDLSRATVAKIANIPYTGSEITLTSEQLKVTAKRNGITETLTPGTDYAVSYAANKEVGTATVTISGVDGKSRGRKSVTFKITGTALNKALVDGIQDRNFSGSAITQNFSVRLTPESAPLTSGTDYTVNYSNNFHAGTAAVTITGAGGYTGSIKKTFKILPVDISTDLLMSYRVNETAFESTAALKNDANTVEAVYTAGGTTPSVKAFWNGRRMYEGSDLAVKYAANTVVTTASVKKNPSFTITGKGDFKGSITKEFKILPSSLNNVKIVIPDKTASAKAGAYISKPVLYDTNGKTLKEGKDYAVVSYKAYYPDKTSQMLDKKSVVNTPGTVIEVKIRGLGVYDGGAARLSNYLIGKTPLSSVKVGSILKEYTGEAVYLSESDFYAVKNGETVSIVTAGAGRNAVPLTYGTDYEIIEGTYVSNVNMGNASVMIRGLGDYAGTAKVTFRIGGRILSLLKLLFH
ncbi:MAG: Ig-like domain-containing protein [Lachnospiraceae bacterium]|nr:Ig-like domain-containing protein [Lachnospiraceae bacterium]